MIPDIEHHRPEVVELCRRFGVQSLEVFGSAADGTFDPARSDIDFLVEFDESDSSNLFRRYFGLAEALEHLFARKVDLVSHSALKTPYFIAAVNRSRQPLYALAGIQAA
jgi:predicted nucleotidyltransferase